MAPPFSDMLESNKGLRNMEYHWVALKIACQSSTVDNQGRKYTCVRTSFHDRENSFPLQPGFVQHMDAVQQTLFLIMGPKASVTVAFWKSGITTCSENP